MDYQELRKRYPIFSFDKYEYFFDKNSLIINYFYSCNELSFIHKLTINNLIDQLENNQLENFIFQIGLSLIPSYWKLTCSPTIQINAKCQITSDQLNFWRKLLIKGMGEYFYKNQIDFTQTDFLQITNKRDEFLQTGAQREAGNDQAGEHPQLQNSSAKLEKKVLIPVGGGKDSIVTLELLKPHFQITAFTINPVLLIEEVINTAEVPAIYVNSVFDPELFELNKQGYLNGHVPISAFYAFTALLVAYLQGIPYIAFSNERSSNEGNTEYLDQEINHQYSKTQEFETDLSEYLKNLKLKIKNFSLLRPLYELQITKLFSKYPQYFNIFSSCNQNFKMKKWPATPKLGTSEGWCGRCPKCVSTSLMLSQFIGKDQVAEIKGAYPPDLPENQKILAELTGNSPVKPFECVLTRQEAIACITRHGINEILSSWQENPNIPQIFTDILKSSL